MTTMNNYEFHKDAIEAFFREELSFAMTKREVVTTCNTIGCEQCIFSKYNNPDTYDLTCGDRKMMWALKEHVEKPALNKYERAFCEALQIGWIARNRVNGRVSIFTKKPTREASGYWYIKDGNCFAISHFAAFNHELKFDFIQWENEEPWSIEELLKLEVTE